MPLNDNFFVVSLLKCNLDSHNACKIKRIGCLLHHIPKLNLTHSSTDWVWGRMLACIRPKAKAQAHRAHTITVHIYHCRTGLGYLSFLILSVLYILSHCYLPCEVILLSQYQYRKPLASSLNHLHSCLISNMQSLLWSIVMFTVGIVEISAIVKKKKSGVFTKRLFE